MSDIDETIEMILGKLELWMLEGGRWMLESRNGERLHGGSVSGNTVLHSWAPQYLHNT